MLQEIKSIATQYNGCRFRSRLEARWAVFLDAVGVDYLYEPSSFVVDGTPYLPDFFIPEWKALLEMKPPGEPTFDDFRLLHGAALQMSASAFLVCGPPCMGKHLIHHVRWSDSTAEHEIGIENLFHEMLDETWFTEIAECRRCSGLCLLNPNEDESAGFMDLGKHRCGTHDKWPCSTWSQFGSKRVRAAYHAAATRRFA
jgi:hypothetical protein